MASGCPGSIGAHECLLQEEAQGLADRRESITESQAVRLIGHTVRDTIAGNRMLQPADRVLIAVSGGADSVALLHLLLDLAPELNIELGVAHLHHGLRPEAADRDARFVAGLAQGLDLPIFSRRVDVPGWRTEMKRSLEDTARILRYRFLNEIADTHRYDRIALGHHADDNAEVVLMHLLRGAGSAGLGGMPAVRGDRIIRPLIRLHRDEILTYLNCRQIPHCTDDSNTDERFLRNRIRHRLIPLLKERFNPNIVDALNRMAHIRRSEEEWIATVVEGDFRDCLLESRQRYAAFSVSALDRRPIGGLRRVIRRAVEQVQGDLKRVEYRHLEAVIHLIRYGPPNGALDLPNAIRVERRYDRLSIQHSGVAGRGRPHPPATSLRPYAYWVPSPGATAVVIDVPEANVRLRFERCEPGNCHSPPPTGQSVVFFDMDKLVFPLLLRNVNPGDRFRPLGMTGHQKVNKFFIDHKVPPAERRRCPLLLSDGIPVWLVGHRPGESAKLDATSRRAVKAEVLLA